MNTTLFKFYFSTIKNVSAKVGHIADVKVNSKGEVTPLKGDKMARPAWLDDATLALVVRAQKYVDAFRAVESADKLATFNGDAKLAEEREEKLSLSKPAAKKTA